MKKFTVLFFTIIISFSAFAQLPSKQQKIDMLIDMTGGAKLGVQLVKNMIGSIKKTYSEVPEEVLDGFVNEFNTDDLKKLIIPIYDRYYTDEDIDALIAFYRSPIGKKTIEVTPSVLTESMAAGAKWGKAIGDQLFEKLKQKGYKQKSL